MVKRKNKRNLDLHTLVPGHFFWGCEHKARLKFLNWPGEARIQSAEILQVQKWIELIIEQGI